MFWKGKPHCKAELCKTELDMWGIFCKENPHILAE